MGKLTSAPQRRDQRSPEAQAYHRWYNTRRWQALRRQQLTKDPLCKMCLDQGRITPANICDHTTPHKGDEALFWNPNNLTSLCKPHHDSTKQREERGATIRSIGLDGWPEG